MAKYYAIVKFIDEEDALGVIPLNWITENEQLCYFPNVKSNAVRDKLIRMRADYEESWVLFPIKILHKYETYSQARLKLKKAEDTSNLDTDEDMPNERRRKRKIQVLPGESEDDDDDTVKTKWKRSYQIKQNIPEYPNFQSSETTTMKRTETSTNDSIEISSESTVRSPVCSSYNNSQFASGSNSPLLNTPSIHYIKNLASNTIRPRTPNSSSSTLSSVLDTDRILLGQMQNTIAAVAEQVVILNNKMDALLNSSQNCYDSNSASEFSLLGHLPLQTTDDFDSFEQKLQEDNFCNKVIQILVSVGGNDLRSCVGNMMRRLMSDSLGEMFSYSGKTINDSKKLPFSKHKLCRSVHVAARKLFKDATDDKIRGLLCNWLQQAKTRRTRRDKRHENENVRIEVRMNT